MNKRGDGGGGGGKKNLGKFFFFFVSLFECMDRRILDERFSGWLLILTVGLRNFATSLKIVREKERERERENLKINK